MENYKAIFEVNEDDIEELDIPYGGNLKLLNMNNMEIGNIYFDFEHFSKKTLDNIIKILKSGIGEDSNKRDNDDFGNGGFFVEIKDNILIVETNHFGCMCKLSLVTNLSLFQELTKMRSYLK